MKTVQSPVAGSVVTKKILVVAPSSLLNNWASEFRKWLGSERLVSISILNVK
jgi:SNF2 family DNA or RNA helicase